MVKFARESPYLRPDCFQFLSTVGGEMIPRPFGPTVYGKKANYLLQIECIDLRAGKRGNKYVPMLRNDHSDYMWFFAYLNGNVENAAATIIESGMPHLRYPQRPDVRRPDSISQRSRPFCHKWSQGTWPVHPTLLPQELRAAERLEKELHRVARSCLSEFKMRWPEWPDLLPIFYSILNNSPSSSRDSVCTITAFMGRVPTPPNKTKMRTSTAKPHFLSDA